MNSDTHGAASARLDTARGDETVAAAHLHAATGTVDRFHASVQLRAAEDQVEARAAWLAWTDRADEAR
jgi:hypothetical protein